MASRWESFLVSFASNAAWWLVATIGGVIVSIWTILKVYLGSFLPLACVLLGVCLTLLCITIIALLRKPIPGKDESEQQGKVVVAQEERFVRELGGDKYQMIRLTLDVKSPINWREHLVFSVEGTVYPKACKLYFKDSYDGEYEVGTVTPGKRADRVVVSFGGERGLPDVATLFMELGSIGSITFKRLEIEVG